MDFFAAELLIYGVGVLIGDETLAVEAGDVDVRLFLHPMIFAGGVLRAVILDGDDADIAGGACRIVDDHHPVWAVNADAVDAHAAGQHQSVVGVELAELAFADGHIHHDAAAHCVIDICAEEGQPRLTAHTAGALKGQISVRPGAEVQTYTLGTEQRLGLFLPDEVFLLRSPPVKDAGEVHVKDDVGKISHQPIGCRTGKGIAVQDAHDLIEQRVVLLFMGRSERLALLRLSGAELEGVSAVLLSAVADDRSGGQLVDLIVRHRLTSIPWWLYSTISY